MLHFPSTFHQSNGLPKRIDSLNATQQKQQSSSNQIFLKIEEELHDARRVHTHGQEDDLRMALNMVICRVSELSTLLSEAYKAQADLEVQLNVAKSNLQLVISNNEMLEEALKSGNPKDVGWRRWSAREGENKARARSNSRPSSMDIQPASENIASPVTTSSPPSTAPNTPAQPQDSRFFRFRFNSSNSNANSRAPSRPQTPTNPQTSPKLANSAAPHHLNSASVPSLPQHAKELEELTAELQKEREAKKTIMQEKAALEAELESLSQALFEEANKMVASERIKRAETEEELKEARQQKEALKSALKIMQGEVEVLRESLSVGGSPTDITPVLARSRSRSSSQVGMKSPPASASPTPPHSRTNSVTSVPPDTHARSDVAISGESKGGIGVGLEKVKESKSVARPDSDPEKLPLPDSPDMKKEEKIPLPTVSSFAESELESSSSLPTSSLTLPSSSSLPSPSHSHSPAPSSSPSLTPTSTPIPAPPSRDPSPSPSATPSTALPPFVPPPPVPNDWLEEGSSPWADVPSSSSRPSSFGNSTADDSLFKDTMHRV